MSDLFFRARWIRLKRFNGAGIAAALLSACMLSVPPSSGAFAATNHPRVKRAAAAAASTPAAIPALTLMRELTALQSLARLNLTPAQRTVLKKWLPSPEAPLGPLTAAEQVNHLLRQQRNAILSGQSLPAGFSAAFDANMILADSWNMIQTHAIERAVEAVLPSLSAGQRSALLKPQPTESQFQAARNLIDRARQPGAADQQQLTARVEKLWPVAGASIAASLNRVPTLAPDQFARERNSLTLSIASLIASSAPAPKNTDAAVAEALVTLLSYPATEEGLAPARGAPDFRNLRESLQLERARIEEQIHTIQLFLCLGFTRAQIAAAEPSLEQADELRDLKDSQSRKIRAKLLQALSDAEADLAAPKTVSGQTLAPPVSDEPDLLAAFQYQTLNIRADDQLAAMAMLNAAPGELAASIAATPTVIERAEEIRELLDLARNNYTLREFLTSQNGLAERIMRYLKPSEGLKAQVEAALGRARLMTDEEFVVRLPALTREIIALGVPDTPPAATASAAAPVTAAQKSAALEAAQQAQNTAAERLGSLLNVEGLWEALQ